MIKQKVAGVLLALAITGGAAAVVIDAVPVVQQTEQASASSLLGVAHTHQGTCPVNNCWTWILANGAVIRGNTDLLVSQYNYVLVVCSQRVSYPPPNPHWQVSTLGQWGPFGNDGQTYPYCVSPYDGNGIRWNQYPLNGGP